MSEFDARSERALLVGPSAGYTLPDAFLRRFSAITVLEPDPIAGLLLMRRLRRLGVRELVLERRDQLLSPLLEGKRGLPELLDADPQRCLVFGNLLGQTGFLLDDSEFERFKASFRERIGRGSHSARGSAFTTVCLVASRRASRGSTERVAGCDDASVLSELYPRDPGARAVELFDHRSDGFFPDTLAHSYFSWPIDRERHHLIEAVSSQR